jgi:hypothetical protein
MRHDRQARLEGVGEVGQRRLAGAVACVAGSGFAAEMAARYLAGAGIGHLRVGSVLVQAAAQAVDPSLDVGVVPTLDVAGPTCPFEWRDPVARDLASGAYLALQIIRETIEDYR